MFGNMVQIRRVNAKHPLLIKIFGMCTSAMNNKNVKMFKVYRWNPESQQKPNMKTYELDLNKCGRTVLDALIKIKAEQDPTLSFRKSCREGICGTCAMNIDGTNQLACMSVISQKGMTTIYPLPSMYVIRDLVTDMGLFFEQYAKIEPWLQRSPMDDKCMGTRQYLQSIEDSEKLSGLYECILCACCQHSCPPYWLHKRKFYGPAILLHAYRWIIDSRDQNHKERLDKLRGQFTTYQCHMIMNCTSVCPKALNPGKAIVEIKKLMSGMSQKTEPEFKNYSLEHCEK